MKKTIEIVEQWTENGEFKTFRKQYADIGTGADILVARQDFRMSSPRPPHIPASYQDVLYPE